MLQGYWKGKMMFQEYITALSSTDTLNKKATEPKINITEMPGKHASNEDFQGN